jgi:hypothetical protein
MSEIKQAGEAAFRKEWTASDLAPILDALRGLRFGSVELIIQDYKLIQIDRNEKFRPQKP